MWLMQASVPDELHDIVVPEAIAWMPQTIGWWILLAALLVLVGWWAWSAHRRRVANRYRVVALEELRRIEALAADSAQRAAGLRALPALVKRTALAVRPRKTVAPVTGKALLQFLDESYPGDAFSNGAGKLLVDAPYWNDERLANVTDAEITVTVGAIRDWIRRHRAEATDV